MDIPLLAIYFLPPADGLPLFHAWLVTAKDVWHRGYEGHREILEIRLNDRVDLLDHGFRSFIPTKGLGRVSCILWAVLWSYFNRDSMDGDAKSDFIRPGLVSLKKLKPQAHHSYCLPKIGLKIVQKQFPK